MERVLSNGMAEQLAEVDAIAESPEEPTLDNTILAPERSEKLLDRVDKVFSNLVGSHSTDRLQEIQSIIVRLLERYRGDFERAGAPLSEDRLRQLNEELSSLSTEFSTRLLAETNASAVLVEDQGQLAGLDQEAVASAQVAARSRGHASGYLLPLILPTAQPALTMLRDRALRERIFRAATSPGRSGRRS